MYVVRRGLDDSDRGDVYGMVGLDEVSVMDERTRHLESAERLALHIFRKAQDRWLRGLGTREAAERSLASWQAASLRLLEEGSVDDFAPADASEPEMEQLRRLA